LNRRTPMTTSLPYSPLRTPAQVLAWFRANGITVAGWARANGFSRSVVNSVLYQNLPGKTGQAHLAAIALGLKAPPSLNIDSYAENVQPTLKVSENHE